MLMNLFDKESNLGLLMFLFNFNLEFTKHFLESKEKNLVFLKQLIDQDLN